MQRTGVDTGGAKTTRALKVEGSVGTLSKGLQIIEVLQQSNSYLPLSGIAAETGLDPSTTYRLLQTLVESGYAVRDDARKSYLAGPRALSPLSLFHPLTQLRREAAPVLKFLQSETGETSALSINLGYERVVVDFVRGNYPLSPYYDSWVASPLHGSASGKLLLAWMTPEQREELLGPGPYKANTPFTITDPAVLARELDAVRESGFAVAREDNFLNLIAIGVPLAFRPRTPPIGCLAITAESSALPKEDEQTVIDRLRAASTLLMSSAPSMNLIRSWSANSVRRASATPQT